ncbi:MAG: hypothetical protein ACOX8W_02700 [bacterium]
MSRTIRSSILTLALVLFVINLAATPFLPELVGVQITRSGNLGNFVPKPLFVIGVPLLAIALGMTSGRKSEASLIGALAAPVIIFLANLMILIINLR